MDLTMYDTEFLIVAIVILTMAFIFYSAGVWNERLQQGLRRWHIWLLGLGLICDLAGVTFMAELLRLTGEDNGGHTVLGSITVFLLAVHVAWAFRTYRKSSVRSRQRFSRFSIAVWSIWLIPYCLGMYMGISARLAVS